MIFAKVRRAALGAAFLLVTACAASPEPEGDASPPASGQPQTSASQAAPGEVLTSDNVTHVVNVPRTAPLNGPMDWNTDLAFQGDYLYMGNFGGFSIFDISEPTTPKIVSQVSCPAQQNDVSVYENLLILSIDAPRSGEDCDSTESQASWEGLRIFDVSDKKSPKYVGAVATECGSHTHTMVPKDGKLFVYVSSPGPEPSSETCPPPHQLLQIVEVPLDDPKSAKVVASPEIPIEGQGEATGCHDITAYPEKNLAAAACFGDGFLLDITDPVSPKLIQQVTDDENFQIWHSATFNNDATKVLFTDELGGGSAPTCTPAVPATKGANAVYDIVDGKLEKRGYFKIPREQQETENCVAHNGSLLPIPGKDIMVQAWYQGGVSFLDFTDSANPKEIGFFERGPYPEDGIAGSWSAYYYNGYVYSADIQMGLDVLKIDDPLTDPAKDVKMDDFNVQTQKSY
ncbi:LVIVD repeat-containing protein [Nonomuraea sp. CA-218870]|uniref:LVIVD repeat-containing protein n=1 Tax=Nonomuraea sp. CA-218870 TaxID=3239998 RepID=UPI003D8BD819